MSETEVLQVS